MLRLTDFQVGGAGDRRAGIDQVGRVQLLGAVFALVTARRLVAAVRAGAGDVAVGQEAVVVDGKDLLFTDFGDEAILGEFPGEMLGQAVVPLAGRAAEMVEGQTEALGDLGLHGVHLGAVSLDRLAGLGGGQFGGRAVFVGCADEHHLMPHRAVEAGEEVGGQLGADEVPQVLDPVDVGNGRGDEDACHVCAFA